MSSTRLCQKLGWPGPSNPEKQLYSTLQIQARTTRCGLWWRYPSPQVRAVKYGLYQYGHHNVMCIRGRMSGERGGVLQSFWGSLSYLICPLQRSIASHRIASHRIASHWWPRHAVSYRLLADAALFFPLSSLFFSSLCTCAMSVAYVCTLKEGPWSRIRIQKRERKRACFVYKGGV